MANKLLMPKIGDMMETGIVASWMKKEGDLVKRGEVVLEITTDKATLEVEAFVEGTVLRIMVQEGEEVPVGTVLAWIGEPGEAVEDPEEKVVSPLVQEDPMSLKPSVPGESAKGKAVSPRARRAALEKQIDLSLVQGTGPSGRIVERDVLAVAAAGTAVGSLDTPKATPLARSVAAQVGVDLARVTGTGMGGKVTRDDVLAKKDSLVLDEVEKLSPMRKVIAQRMALSKRETPHFYLSIAVDMSEITEARRQLNEMRNDGVKLSFNDFVVVAVGKALYHMPNIRAQWADGAVRKVQSVHVGVAVSVEDGLVVPVVKDVDQKDIWEISKEIRDLAERARARRLIPDEYSGGTLTVTNLGMFGIDEFLAIINPPESAILSVGVIKKVPVVVEEALEIRPMCTLCLSADHRVIDGAEGARFLTLVRKLMENPLAMFVGGVDSWM